MVQSSQAMDPKWWECRTRRKYSPLFTFQKRARHLRGLNFRNLNLPEGCQQLELQLTDLEGCVICEAEPRPCTQGPLWKELELTGSPTSKGIIIRLSGDGKLFLEWKIYFSGLVFVSRHPPDKSVQFAENSVLVLFTEGVYCDRGCFNVCDGTDESEQSNNIGVLVNPDALCDVRAFVSVERRRLKKSYGINALNRLTTTEKAIRHTVNSAQKLQHSLEGRLQTRTATPAEKLTCDVEDIRLKCKVLKAVLAEREAVLQRETELVIQEELALSKLKEDFESAKEQFESARQSLAAERDALRERKAELDAIGLLKLRVGLICELDDFVYPIEPVTNGFEICQVFIPAALADFKDPKKCISDQSISTGMAYVFHLVSMVSSFAGIPLIYPLKYERNNPVIVDVNLDSYHHKEFALWVKGKDRLYFEHAVPLLALNVAQLRTHFGLPSMRGRLMAGLHGLMTFFHKQRKKLSSEDQPDHVSTSSNHRDAVLTSGAESAFSSHCATPEQNNSPVGTPRLRTRMHSVPNLNSKLTGDSVDCDPGTQSDNATTSPNR